MIKMLAVRQLVNEGKTADEYFAVAGIVKLGHEVF
jgi:hypothetical protein